MDELKELITTLENKKKELASKQGTLEAKSSELIVR